MAELAGIKENPEFRLGVDRDGRAKSLTELVVLKFGGGILESRADFERAATIVAGTGGQAIVVVSAIKGVTDYLLEALQSSKREEKAAAKYASGFRNAHEKIIALSAITALSEKLERALAGAYYAPDSERLHDTVLSFGERASLEVFSHFLANITTCSSFESEGAGIVSNGVFENASCEIEATRRNISKLLEINSGKTIVVTGFYGVDAAGNVNLFGRGGSDYAAGAIAAAAGAKKVILYKDVPGFLRADPKTVQSPERISRVSFNEAAELGYFGSKIVHPRTFDPLKGTGTTVEIRPFSRPESAGTIVEEKTADAAAGITAIASKKNVELVETFGGGMVNAQGVAAGIFSCMAQAGIGVDVIATSQADITFTIDGGQANAASTALEHLSKSRPDVVESFSVSNSKSLVAVVGAITPKVMARALSTMQDNGIELSTSSFGASKISFSMVIPECDERRALQALYAEFFASRTVQAPAAVTDNTS